MKKYLAVFVAPVESYDKMKAEMKTKGPEEQKAQMAAWERWMTAHKANLVDPGAPVGSAKRVTPESVTDTHNTIGGYMMVQAEDFDQATEIFKDVPHFGVEGAAIEVMEIMPM